MELQSNKKGYVYALTSSKYSNKNIVKIGRTTNLKNRLSTINTSRIKSDLMFYTMYVLCPDCIVVERLLHSKLKKFHVEKEFFQIHPRTLARYFDHVRYLIGEKCILRSLKKL